MKSLITDVRIANLWLEPEMSDGISVVTTTWNERENIKELILRIRSTLENVPHEIIVVDDTSSDGTFEVASSLADLAFVKRREGQTKGLLYGMRFAKFPIIVTIDSDLENNPELIPKLVEGIGDSDLVVASRTVIPRVSERLASKTIGRKFGVSDFFSNFRAYKVGTIAIGSLIGGETFGGELLVIAKKRGFRIGELCYEPPLRRQRPRIGGNIKANLRITLALLKCWVIYLI